VWLHRFVPNLLSSRVREYVCACPVTMNAPCFRQISYAPHPTLSPLYDTCMFAMVMCHAQIFHRDALFRSASSINA
jgi:hypothetical protein